MVTDTRPPRFTAWATPRALKRRNLYLVRSVMRLLSGVVSAPRFLGVSPRGKNRGADATPAQKPLTLRLVRYSNPMLSNDYFVPFSETVNGTAAHPA